MKKTTRNIKYICLLAASISLSACSSDDDGSSNVETPKPALVAGDADFTKYIAVGASFSAGFTDNALFIAGQNNSFPNMLSQKFALVGGGSFTQPLMNDNYGGMLLGGTRILEPRLVTTGGAPQPLESVIGPVTVTTNLMVNNPAGPFNNFGIPGLKSFHLGAPGYGNVSNLPNANPYFARMTGATPNASVMQLAAGQAPTFFTLSEIGGNDVLSFAIGGGYDAKNNVNAVSQEGNTSPGTYGPNDITDSNVFAASFSATVDALTANGAKGVVANVPYITTLAHFTTVPYNPVPLDAGTATALNQGYAAYNGGLQQALAALSASGLFTAEEATTRTINFSEGEGNALVIIDEDLTDLGAINPAFAGIPQYRQATAEDLFVLPLSSLIPQGYGTQIPLEDKWVLTPEEQLLVKTATDAYNATILSIAANKGLAVVDFKAILEQASTTGYPSGNNVYTTDLVTGGLISLDGIHLTARGYAIMANEMMKAIDVTYGSNFEASGSLIDTGSLPTNYSPLLQ